MFVGKQGLHVERLKLALSVVAIMHDGLVLFCVLARRLSIRPAITGFWDNSCTAQPEQQLPAGWQEMILEIDA